MIWPRFSSEYSDVWSAAPAGTTYAENHLLGYVGAEDTINVHMHETRDRCLFQIDSDEAADFQWGDYDWLYFILTNEQLAAWDFSKVRVYSHLG